MIIDNSNVIAIVLDNAMNIRNAVNHNSTPFSIVIMFFFISSLVFEDVMLMSLFKFHKLSEVLFISFLT